MVFPWTKRIDWKEKLLSCIIYKIRTINEWFLFLLLKMNYFNRLQSTYNKNNLPHNIRFDYYLHMGKNQKRKRKKRELNIMGYNTFVLYFFGSSNTRKKYNSIRVIFFSPYSYINHKIWCRKHLSNYIIWPIISSLLSNNVHTFE